MKRQRTPLALAVITALALAACSSGESVITSGNDPEPTAADDAADDAADEPVTDDAAGSDAAPATDAAGAVDAGSDAAPATTAPSPLADLPGCPTALPADGDLIEITFWHGLNVENEEALQAITDAYNASQSRVRVNLQNQGSYQDTIDEYYLSGDDSRPDIVMFPEYAMQQAIDSGTVLPAGACVESSGFDSTPIQPAVLEAYSAGGVLWGMPFNVSVPVLYYRRDLYSAAGLSPTESPTTLAEVREFSEALAAAGVFGLAVDSDIDSGGGWFIEEWFAAVGEPYADNDNGRSARSTEVYFDGEFGVDLLTFLQELVDDDLAFYVGDNTSGSDHFFKMADPDKPASMTIGTSAALGSVIAALSGGLIEGLGPDDVGIGPLPSPSGEPAVIVGGAANYVVAGKDDATTAAVWDFLTYLVGPEVQAEWSIATGYLPLRDDALAFEPVKSTFENDPRYRVAYDQLAASAGTAGTGPLLGPHRQIRTELANAVAAIMTGADVASSLEAAATIAEAYLADYNATN